MYEGWRWIGKRGKGCEGLRACVRTYVCMYVYVATSCPGAASRASMTARYVTCDFRQPVAAGSLSIHDSMSSASTPLPASRVTVIINYNK